MSSGDTTPIGPVVVTWAYDEITIPDWYFETSKAYLDCGLRTYIQLKDGNLPLNYHYARVAKHLYDHSLELFFKGVILQAKQQPTGTHDLAQLHRTFINLCPGKAFAFSASINEMVTSNPNRPHSEYGRYPTAKDWKLWKGGDTFQDIGLRVQEYKNLQDDFERLIPLIKQRYPD